MNCTRVLHDETPLPLLLDLLLHDSLGVRSLEWVLLDEEVHDEGEDGNEEEPHGGGAEAGNVAGSVSRGPEEDTVDGSRVTEGVDEGDGDGTLLGWEGDDIGDPGECQGADGVDAAKGEDDEDVLHHVVLNGDDDDEAEAGDEASGSDEVGLALGVVGSEAKGEDENEGAGVERDSVVLSAVALPAEVRNEGWDEVLDGLGASAHHVHEDEDPGAPVTEAHLASLPVAELTLGTLGVGETIVGQTLGGEEAFFGAQELGGGRPVGHEVPGEATEEGRADTLDDEEPLPSGDAALAVEVLGDQTSEKTTKCS